MYNDIIYMYIISHNSSERRSIFNVSRWVEALQCYHVTACFTACIGVHSLQFRWITQSSLDFSLALFKECQGRH